MNTTLDKDSRATISIALGAAGLVILGVLGLVWPVGPWQAPNAGGCGHAFLPDDGQADRSRRALESTREAMRGREPEVAAAAIERAELVVAVHQHECDAAQAEAQRNFLVVGVLPLGVLVYGLHRRALHTQGMQLVAQIRSARPPGR